MEHSLSYNLDELYQDALRLLKALIAIPSLSREEEKTADCIESFFTDRGITTRRSANNIWATNKSFDLSKPTILLNSHHDTVKPNSGYTKDPFIPVEEEGKLYGLGSNDAGGALVSLLMTFLTFYDQLRLPYNLVFAATAEEEISGKDGISSVLTQIGELHLGIVGEPTQMEIAVSEKGLMVLDCYAKGQSGHAARDIGDNAIYKSIRDIEWFKEFSFPNESSYLGPVKMSVTMIDAGSQHNVIPDTCHFVVDVRTTDAYTNQETLEIIEEHVSCEVKARSTRLQPSRIALEHPVIKAADSLGFKKFGSPTMSDQALIPYPTIKMGPGLSERSHTADEFIFTDEIKSGIAGYINLLQKLFTLN